MNKSEFIVSLADVATFPKFGFADSFHSKHNLTEELIAFSKTCQVLNLDDGIKYFNPRPYQVEYFKKLVNSPMLICKKCRQCGATTMNLIYAHWKTATTKNHDIYVICNSSNSAHIQRDIFKLIHKEANTSINKVWFLSALEFSSIFSHILFPRKPEFDKTIDMPNSTFIFDEYAFYTSLKLDERNDINEFIRRLSKFKNSQVIVTSTMNTHEDAFSKLFDEADESNRHVISCYDVCNYYKLNEIRSAISDKQFKLEYDA